MHFYRKALVISLLTVAALSAQTNRGTIAGSVLDPHGSAVPHATVIITNVGTNQAIRLTTSKDGAYSSPQVDPVTYQITVDATGFKTEIVNNVKVDTASVTTVDVRLQVGQSKETVGGVGRLVPYARRDALGIADAHNGAVSAE